VTIAHSARGAARNSLIAELKATHVIPSGSEESQRVPSICVRRSDELRCLAALDMTDVLEIPPLESTERRLAIDRSPG
jgi:hypothetical protein